MTEQENPSTVTERQLPDWLLQRVPALQEAYEAEVEDYGSPYPSVYFVLSFVLKPHLLELLDAGNEQEAQRLFDLLEYLAEHGDASVQNELGVTMEEVDVWRVWRFLGPRLRAGEMQSVTWYLGDEAENAHVDQERYRKRWKRK